MKVLSETVAVNWPLLSVIRRLSESRSRLDKDRRVVEPEALDGVSRTQASWLAPNKPAIAGAVPSKSFVVHGGISVYSTLHEIAPVHDDYNEITSGSVHRKRPDIDQAVQIALIFLLQAGCIGRRGSALQHTWPCQTPNSCGGPADRPVTFGSTADTPRSASVQGQWAARSHHLPWGR